MAQLIQNKITNFYDEINQWAWNRELSLPLEAKKNQLEGDECKLEPQIPSLLERVIFRACTSLDLTIVRQLKCALSPRFEELVHKANSSQESKIRNKANCTTERVRLECEFCLGGSLEAYELDKRLSNTIEALQPIKEHLEEFQTTNSIAKALSEHPIQFSLAMRVRKRISSVGEVVSGYDRSLPTYYDREADRFTQIKPTNETEKGYFSCDREFKANVTESLTKRIDKDIQNRVNDPQCQLEFVKNEVYEAALQRRQSDMHTFWIKSIASIVLAAVGTAIYRKCSGFRTKLICELRKIEPRSIVDFPLLHQGNDFLKAHGLQGFAKIAAGQAVLFGLAKYCDYRYRAQIMQLKERITAS